MGSNITFDKYKVNTYLILKLTNDICRVKLPHILNEKLDYPAIHIIHTYS